MTRHPKSKKRWTTLELKAIPAAWAGETLSDGDGLSGDVRVAKDGSISVRFKYAFKWAARVAWYQCGTWPKLGMEAIRTTRDNARELLRQGVNPRDHTRAERISKQSELEATIAQAARDDAQNLPFQKLFEAWIADGVARKDDNGELRRAFGKDVLPAIATKPVKDVTEHDLRAILRIMVKRGVNRMAVRTYHDLVQLFRWASRRQPWRTLLAEGNPADLLEIQKIVAENYDINTERDRILDSAEIRELHAILARTNAAYGAATKKYEAIRPLKKETQLAIWICLSTMCRIGELLVAEWRHVNLKRGEWFIPKANVKATRGKQQDQLVFLSSFALEHFKTLQELTGDGGWCFPARNTVGPISVKTISKQIGDRQVRFKERKCLGKRQNNNSLVLSKGKNGEWTPHDLRRTGATIMQSLKVSLDVIDRCQNHVLAGSRVRRHYLHHDYAEEKRDAWQLLGRHIEATLATTSAGVK
jgi:integrase